MDGEFRTKAEEKAHLTKIIKEWNDSRLDMFALTLPDSDLQFHGVMRFYFQDAGMKVVTKCIRVSSKTSVGELMDTLVEKFCPDMKMLTPTTYELYECHEKGDTRKLGKSERPLLVQLSWHRDDREGRFLLKSATAKVATKFFDINREEGQFKRRLSRREKKQLKKKRKEELLREKDKGRDDAAIAQQLYNELPETSLTRSISNPEAVMKRRRQQKLEKRLKEFQKNDGQQTGGTLKIFAETLKPEIPYKTILASINQTSDKIVKDAIEKFQLEEKNPDDFCIVMAMIPPGDNPGPGKERVVRDNDCPLAIQSSWPSSRGFLTFHLRKRYTVPGYRKDKPGKKASESQADTRAAERLAHNKSVEEDLPVLMEIVPVDADYQPRMLRIKPNVTVVGSSKSPLSEQYFALHAPDVMHQHCVIANMEGAVTITPSNSESLVIVNGQRIHETTVLRHGSVVNFGKMLAFEFTNGDQDGPLNQSVSSNRSFNENNVRSPRMDQSFDERSNEMNRSNSVGDRPYQSLSPVQMEQILSEQSGSKVDDELIVETTFGVDGEIESSPVRKTAPTGFTKSSNDIHEMERENEKRIIDMGYGQSAPDLAAMGNHKQPSSEQLDQDLALLPASLEFIDDAQDVFLAATISEVNGAAVHFKLAPAYSLYLACHYMISPDYRPELGGVEHARVVGITTRKMAIAMEKTVEENDGLAGSLAFWMANASELLHFLKQDMELSPLTQNAQGILAQTVQHAFRLLVLAMEDELALAMPAFLDPSEHVDIPEQELEHILEDDMLERAESSDLLNWTSDERTFPVQDGRPISGHHWVTPAARIRHHGQPVLTDVLYILSSAMSLLRRCRVNAALTIQLFSQLFHFINMWLFNKLVLEPQLGLCTRTWGQRLRRRLSFVEAWAEKQGLELATECHLCRVVQAAHLLEAPKISAEDIASITQNCYKLNSLQLRALLRMYRPDRNEHVISPELIETVAKVAENTADELVRSDGRDIRLDEDEELQLPFLLPEDGYSCDIIRGVPSGLQEFLEALIQSGICNFAVEPMSSGMWTIHQEQYYDDYDRREINGQEQPHFEDEKPEIIEVTLQKGNRGLGLSIVAAKGPKSDDLGIYIKGVVEGGTAHQNGMLQPSDQLLSVNGMSLVGVSQETAAKLMGKAEGMVTLEVFKQAAVYHGLAAFLSQPSPVSSPAPVSKSNGKMSFEDQLERSPTINEQSPQIRTQRWIDMNNKQDIDENYQGEEGDYSASALERKRREEEEYYQAQEDMRIEEDRRRLEQERIEMEEQARMEEIKREEARQAELKRVEEENIRKENQRRMEEARLAEAKRIEEEREERARREREELERLEQEKAREAEQQRLEEENARRMEEQRIKEQRRLEEERRREEEIEKERLRKEEEEEEEELIRKQEEEQRRFEKRQREYEERLRIMEQQQREFDERKRAKKEEEEKKKRMEEEKIREEKERQEEEWRKQEAQRRQQAEERRRQEEEARRREEERKREEEAKKRREEERKKEEEAKKRREEARRRDEEERKRREEERRRAEQERLRRQEEERKRMEEERIREEQQRKEQKEMEMRLQMQAPDDDFDDLPPPPEDMLFGDYDDENTKDEQDQLEIRIQNQLAAEKEEHISMQREQQKWRELDDYEETDIDNVDDRELEQRLTKERGYPEDRSFSMDPDDVEREFQRRLQEENEKRQRGRSPLDDHEDIERLRSEREGRLEHERRIQLMIDDHDRRKNARQYGNNTDLDNHAAVAEQQNKLQSMRISSAPKSPPADDFMALQRQKRLQQKQEQERLRNEQREMDELERQRKLKEVREQKEQEQKMMQEYKRQKELDEQRYTRNNVSNLSEHKNIVKNEFKDKALADYERRRATLDKQVEKMEREKQIRSLEIKAPPVAKKPTSITISANDDDEPPPPRPPPPSNPTPTAIVRSSVSPSPSPHLPSTTRFSYSAKTVANVTGNSQARTSSTSPPNRYSPSPTSPPNRYSPSGQNRNMLSTRSSSRDDPSVIDFKQKIKMFGSQTTATNNDSKSTYSRKLRGFMD